MSKLKELRESRGVAYKALTDILTGPDSAESRGKAKELIAEMDRLQKECDAIQSRGLSKIGEGFAGDKDTDVEYRRAFVSYLRKGEGRLNDTERETLSQHRERRDISEGNLLNQIGTYTGLGYFVPAGFVYDVEAALKYFCPFMDNSVFGSMETASGQPLPWPTSNDTTNVAQLVGEGSTVNEEDVTAGHITFCSYKYSSGLVKASLELIQDSAFPLEAWLAERFATRFGRKFEDTLTNGTGVSQPTGILTAMASNNCPQIVAAGSSANDGNGSNTGVNSIGYADLVNLEHAVDPTYRRGASYMFHDSTLAALQLLLDKYGRPLWSPGIADGAPDRINGKPYVINQAMPTIAAHATTVVYGSLQKFMVRKVKGFSLMVLRERYAELGQQAYLGFMRLDSNLLDAGTHPVASLIQHS